MAKAWVRGRRQIATAAVVSAIAGLAACRPGADRPVPPVAGANAESCPDLSGTYIGDASRAHYDLVLNTLRLHHQRNTNPQVRVQLNEERELVMLPQTQAPGGLATLREPATAYRCEGGALHLGRRFTDNVHYLQAQGPGAPPGDKSLERTHVLSKNAAGALVIQTTHHSWSEVSWWAPGGTGMRVPGSSSSRITHSLWPPLPSEAAAGSSAGAGRPTEAQLIEQLLQILPAGARHTASATRDGYRFLSFRWDSALTTDRQLSALAREVRSRTPAEVRSTLSGPAIDGFDIMIASGALAP